MHLSACHLTLNPTWLYLLWHSPRRRSQQRGCRDARRWDIAWRNASLASASGSQASKESKLKQGLKVNFHARYTMRFHAHFMLCVFTHVLCYVFFINVARKWYQIGYLDLNLIIFRQQHMSLFRIGFQKTIEKF